jgi:hypothetical protein
MGNKSKKDNNNKPIKIMENKSNLNEIIFHMLAILDKNNINKFEDNIIVINTQNNKKYVFRISLTELKDNNEFLDLVKERKQIIKLK